MLAPSPATTGTTERASGKAAMMTVVTAMTKFGLGFQEAFDFFFDFLFSRAGGLSARMRDFRTHLVLDEWKICT
jgi:hypothetical protein